MGDRTQVPRLTHTHTHTHTHTFQDLGRVIDGASRVLWLKDTGHEDVRVDHLILPYLIDAEEDEGSVRCVCVCERESECVWCDWGSK